MKILDDNTFKKVKEVLSEMKNPVRLVVFKSDGNETGELLESLAIELKDANPLISFESHDISNTKEATAYKATFPGTMCLVGNEKRYLKILGLPSGLEFLPFLQTILDVSRGSSDIPRDMEFKIKSIGKPLNLKVFVTPTCPYCPGTARFAHIMALANPNISSEVVEANEFPELSRRYQVSGVPRMVINDVLDLVGAQPPEEVFRQIAKL